MKSTLTKIVQLSWNVAQKVVAIENQNSMILLFWSALVQF